MFSHVAIFPHLRICVPLFRHIYLYHVMSTWYLLSLWLKMCCHYLYASNDSCHIWSLQRPFNFNQHLKWDKLQSVRILIDMTRIIYTMLYYEYDIQSTQIYHLTISMSNQSLKMVQIFKDILMEMYLWILEHFIDKIHTSIYWEN